EEYFLLAERFFNCRFKRPEYQFNQRGIAAGTAHLQRNIIKLNPILFTQNKNEFFQQVIPHEVAHLVVFQRFGKVRPHGKEWQGVVWKIFNRPPDTTHKLNVDDVVGQQFLYRCRCAEHKLTIRRHNKILRGAKYKCRHCKSELVADE
ncbi:MAG TPA: SprT family zinc-dependent metalloprotease, partial [Psychromonas hadalis]|nr:SprT family zinc-dependent metalloprotease [Psychromonas hadalis]